MKRLLLLLVAAFLCSVCSAQELILKPVPYKSAPAEASTYLKNLKYKTKKAKWSVSQTGVFVADFQKKKETKYAFYFTPVGKFLYKRTPIQESDLPKAVKDALGDRMKGPGTKLFLFEGTRQKYYAVCIPAEPGTYVSHYFTPEGQFYEMYFQ